MMVGGLPLRSLRRRGRRLATPKLAKAWLTACPAYAGLMACPAYAGLMACPAYAGLPANRKFLTDTRCPIPNIFA